VFVLERKKFYVNIGSGEISQTKFGNNDEFTIHATNDEILLLRSKLNNMHGASWQSFWRAHVPIMPYHNDKPNDRYDDELAETYQMLYDLGDDNVKKHIEEIGVLGNNPL
jgi:hypothetical protein